MIETLAEKLNLDFVYRFINATEYFDIVKTAEEFNELSAGCQLYSTTFPRLQDTRHGNWRFRTK